MVPKKRPISYVDKKVNELNNRCDELEAKNYQLKSDIDRIIKAIEYYKMEVIK
jgi:peptidoglycan hydrolase CwlO-like protein